MVACRPLTGELEKHLRSDATALITLINDAGVWDPHRDAKLHSLIELLTQRHPTEKVLVFTQFGDTVQYLAEQLSARGIAQVAGVTGDSDNPTDLAWRFSPVSNKKRDRVPPDRELRVLIATDILSEGQNLQDCSIVVNFDLPWAIIRLIQRAGRVDRIGQQSERILCYSFLPADGVERIIRLRARVHQRLHDNAEVVGTDEAFFEGDDEQQIIDLYNENAGILDGPDDREVDLASYAYQIWKNALDADPTLEKTITALPDVVYATRRHLPTPVRPEGVLVYARTAEDNDALAYVNEQGVSITESQYEILHIAECAPDTPAIPRHEKHHSLVQQAVQHIATEEKQVGGQLGRPSGARFRTYERLKRHAEHVRGTLFETPELLRVIDDIYRYPLRQVAVDMLNRQLRVGVDDQHLADLTTMLREEGRLSIVEEQAETNAIYSFAHLVHVDRTSENGMPTNIPAFSMDISSLPAGSRYQIIIGKNGKAVEYGDIAGTVATGYKHPAVITSPWLAANEEWNLCEDWDNNHEITDHGLYGGQIRYITFRASIPDESGNRQEFERSIDYGPCKGIYIIGTNPTPSQIDAYIEHSLGLGVVTINQKFVYRVLQNGLPAIVDKDETKNPTGWITHDVITVSEGGTSHALADTYVLQQLKIMLKKMHRQEASSHQFHGDNVGWASKDGYPMWQNSDTANSHCGLGLTQLSKNEYKSRETMWDWKKNILKACKVTLDNFSTSCTQWDAHHPTVPDSLFQPGVIPTPDNCALTLDLLRRLNTYTKFNGGANDRYCWWNEIAPAPVLVDVNPAGSITGGGATEAFSVTGFDLTLQNVQHTVTAATKAQLHGYDVSGAPLAEKTGGVASGFNWSIGNQAVSNFVHEVTDPDAGESPDHELWYQLCLFTDSGLAATARICDNSNAAGDTGKNAGFRPAQNKWVKFGVVATGDGNSGWRDYNTDGVQDSDGNPFDIPGFDPNSTNSLDNKITGRTAPYAERCEKQTPEH